MNRFFVVEVIVHEICGAVFAVGVIIYCYVVGCWADAFDDFALSNAVECGIGASALANMGGLMAVWHPTINTSAAIEAIRR